MKLNLFNQNPKLDRYEPDAATRSIQGLRLNRKEDLEKFRKWMEGVSREKSGFPGKDELAKLNKETSSARPSALGIIGSLIAIPVAGFAIKSLTGGADISSILSGGISSLGNMFGNISSSLGLSNILEGFGFNVGDKNKSEVSLPDAPEVSGTNTTSPTTTTAKADSESTDINVEPPAVTPKLEVENPFKELFDFIAGVFNPKSSGTSGTQPAQPTTGASKLIDLVPYEDFSRTSSEGGRGMVGKSDGGAYDPRGTINGRGYPHYGVDIGTSGQKGYYVALKVNGKVSVNQYHAGGGNMLFIKVGSMEYVFMHLAHPSELKVGENYSAGTPIGEIGRTGRSSDIHLHFEVRPSGGGAGSAIDPNPYLNMIEIGKLNPNPSAPTDTSVSGEPTVPDVAQQDQPNPIVESLSSLFNELAPVIQPIMEEVNELMKIPQYMQEYKEGSRVPYEFGELNMTDPSYKVETPTSDPLISNSNVIEPAPIKNQNVSMLSPEAEEELNTNTIIINQQSTSNSDQGAMLNLVGGSPDGTTGSSGDIVIAGGMDMKDTYRILLATKIG